MGSGCRSEPLEAGWVLGELMGGSGGLYGPRAEVWGRGRSLDHVVVVCTNVDVWTPINDSTVSWRPGPQDGILEAQHEDLGPECRSEPQMED